MGFHTFDPAKTDRLEDPTRFRFCSREELLQHLPSEESRILDVGSGTGFYTDELVPFVGEIVALDVQQAMHDQYQQRGIPATVTPVTATADSLPFHSQVFDGAVSTMTFHESATQASTAELFRVLTDGGSVVIVDWSRNGRGEAGPPRTERYDATSARKFLTDAGFSIELEMERSETFLLVGSR